MSRCSRGSTNGNPLWKSMGSSTFWRHSIGHWQVYSRSILAGEFLMTQGRPSFLNEFGRRDRKSRETKVLRVLVVEAVEPNENYRTADGTERDDFSDE